MKASACLLLFGLGMSSAANAGDDLTFAIWKTGAFFAISPTGRLEATFGSTPGDHAYLPEGSVDYELVRALLPAVQDLDSKALESGVVSVTGERRMRSAREAGVLIYVVCSKANKWRLDESGDQQRVQGLLRNSLTACRKLQDDLR